VQDAWGDPLIQFVWEFIARVDKIAEFEKHYSATGSWATLFGDAPGYRGTTLWRDAQTPRRYLTMDRWDSIASQHAMRERCAEQYAALDRESEAFTETERQIGVFEEK
jgi:heme-degrading monooxygenase HmoA